MPRRQDKASKRLFLRRNTLGLQRYFSRLGFVADDAPILHANQAATVTHDPLVVSGNDKSNAPFLIELLK
jgi:hypothetical protein